MTKKEQFITMVQTTAIIESLLRNEKAHAIPSPSIKTTSHMRYYEQSNLRSRNTYYHSNRYL